MLKRSRVTIVAAGVLFASALVATAQVPLGSEFRVDTYGFVRSNFTHAWSRSAAMAPDGTFVLTWVRDGGPPGGLDVAGRRFRADGVAQGPEFIINSNTTGLQYNEAVGIDDAGNFTVVWLHAVSSAAEVFGQRFDRSGTRLGAEFQVGAPPQLLPSLAVAPGGDFVVVWVASDADAVGIFGQLYDAQGAPVGGEFQVNTYTTGQQYRPSVDFDGAGNFVVVWASGSFSVGDLDVFGQRFTAGGARQGAEFAVNSDPSNYQGRPRIARSRDGSFVVAWQQLGGVVEARRFDANGVPLGNDFQVNQNVGGSHNPEVDSDADGDFVITWAGNEGGGLGVFGRRFDASGAAGPEFRVNTYTTGIQWKPHIAADSAGNFVVAWHDYEATGTLRAQRYAGGLSAAALAVDGSASTTSDGNGVFEPGETVTVAPSWLNANFTAETFTGTASAFTGPGSSTYTIADGAASYGTVASNATGSCTTTADCYALAVVLVGPRPALHWDASVHEQIAPANLGAAKTWTLHIGDSFADVPRASGFYRFIERILHHGITGGCTATDYCPLSSTTREQMAVFVLVAKDGAGNIPPACTTPMFNDVPANSPFCPWIEELARRGVVAGCGGGNYCPTAPVSREQMAVFVLLTKEPGVVPPACGTPMFNDVPASSGFCRWIEELARRSVVTGCGGGNYCPTAAVTREQMAVFVSATFGFALYGP